MWKHICDDISDCLYIRSNGIPNYIPFKYENQNDNDIIEMTVKMIVYGDNINGLDRQAYSYVSNSRRILGYPFKIPLNPQLTDLKTIPNDNRFSLDEKFQNENFWYRSDENWDKIMVNVGYGNFDFDIAGTSLLPIGQIGVFVNGIPFHSPATMKNSIIETPITANLSIRDPVVIRTLKKDNSPLSGIVDENDTNDNKSNSIFDNYGGSVDFNSVYNYKRYPIGLEADIILGSIGYDTSSISSENTTEEKRNRYINSQKQKINNMLQTKLTKISDKFEIKIKNEVTSFVRINLSDFSLKNQDKIKLSEEKFSSEPEKLVTIKENIFI